MNHFKYTLLIGCAINLFASINCHATQLTPLQSLNRALQYKSSFFENSYAAGKTDAKETFTLIGTGTNNGKNTYYAMTSDKRTLIIAADNQFKPILGILDYPLDSLSQAAPGMIELLEGITGGINECNNTQEDLYFNESKIKDATHNPLRVRMQIAPLISTHWHQHAPYNQATPTFIVDESQPDKTEHYVTGCVPTAVAQILNYYRHPAHLVNYGQLFTDSIDRGVVKFDDKPQFAIQWDDILPSYEEHYYNDDNAQAVANLLFGVGLALRTNYRRDGSGADLSKTSQAFVVNFDRYAEINYIKRSDREYKNNPTAWENTFYTEIANLRPVLFVGYRNDLSSGHGFILDGYKQAADGTNYFHINYGWGVGYDGYFTLTAGSANPTKFTARQEAIIGIKPTPQPIDTTSISANPETENDEIHTAATQLCTSDIQTSNHRYFTLEGIEIQSPLQPGCYIQKSKAGSKMIVIK